MATTIRIYNQADNKYYSLTVDALANVLDTDGTDMNVDYYIKITTTMKKKLDNSSFPQYLIKDLTDVPPGYSTAATFTDLIDDYIDYFITQANLGWSSSSSSSSSSLSSSSSNSTSSSSSVGYSSSSSSSSVSSMSSSSMSSSSESSSSSV